MAAQVNQLAWTDEPPLHYQVQVQHQMMSMGLDWGIIAVLVGGNEFQWFLVRANGKFMRALQERLSEWWLYVANELSERMRIPVRVTNLAYLQRGGSPSPFDRILATRFGAAAIEFALDGRSDVMTAIHGTKIVPVPLGEALANPRPVDENLLYLVNLFE